jgi:F420H(2)-dependent quinone reductase
MAKYIPSPRDWVREQVELYENSGGNLRVNPHIELRDETIVRPMRVREVKDAVDRARLWTLAVAAYPPYADYQARTERQIPLFVAEP